MFYSGTVFVVSLFPYYSDYHLFLLFLPLLSQVFLVRFHESIFLLECDKTPSNSWFGACTKQHYTLSIVANAVWKCACLCCPLRRVWSTSWLGMMQKFLSRHHFMDCLLLLLWWSSLSCGLSWTGVLSIQYMSLLLYKTCYHSCIKPFLDMCLHCVFTPLIPWLGDIFFMSFIFCLLLAVSSLTRLLFSWSPLNFYTLSLYSLLHLAFCLSPSFVHTVGTEF